jgi:hypothetical protein
MWSFDRWRALTASERWLTVKSAVLVALAAAALRGLGVKRTLRLATQPVRGTSRIVIDELAAAVDRAGRYVPGATCLSQSIALAWMLRRDGVDAAVRIGVRTGGGFEAHAWVEASGLHSARPAPFTPLEL